MEILSTLPAKQQNTSCTPSGTATKKTRQRSRSPLPEILGLYKQYSWQSICFKGPRSVLSIRRGYLVLVPPSSLPSKETRESQNGVRLRSDVQGRVRPLTMFFWKEGRKLWKKDFTTDQTVSSNGITSSKKSYLDNAPSLVINTAIFSTSLTNQLNCAF